MRFLLVDRIGDVDPGVRIAGSKNVAMSEDYLEWHFPEQPIVPGMLVLEAMVQLAGWLVARESDFASWFLLDRVESARYYGFAVPGNRLDLTVEAIDGDDPARRRFAAECAVDGERRAVARFEGPIVDLDTLESRERAERTFRVLRGEATPGAGGRGSR